MRLIQAIVKPFKVEDIKEALEEIGIYGMTVAEVKGHGRQGGHTEVYRGSEYQVDFVPKSEILIAVEDEDCAKVCKAIQETAKTGKIGDGKIFILTIESALRIRTGEMDQEAL